MIQLLMCLAFLLAAPLISSYALHRQTRRTVLSALEQGKDGADSAEQNLRDRASMRDIAEPLLDVNLIRDVLDAWTRPLPASYLTSPLVLSGPSGVGKNRLVTSLLVDYNKYFKRCVTHTTRRPREGEVNGTHYHFVPKEVFAQLVERGDYFLENAKVHGNHYGLSKESYRNVTNLGKISIFEIDVQGARSLREVGARANGLTPRYLFIEPVSMEALRDRLITRGTESSADMELRVSNAAGEVEAAREKGLFDRTLVNADFEMTSRAFFRTARDWYPALPSASRIRMLQRRVAKIKAMAAAAAAPRAD